MHLIGDPLKSLASHNQIGVQKDTKCTLPLDLSMFHEFMKMKQKMSIFKVLCPLVKSLTVLVFGQNLVSYQNSSCQQIS